MRLLLTGRQLEVSPSLRKLVDARLAKIDRRLGRAVVSAAVVLSRERNRYVTELTVHIKGDHILHGIGTTKAWGTSLTSAVQKVVQQVETLKGKWEARKRSGTRRPRSRG